jgi:thiol-disulfide isomerase/thioredoxin
MVAVVAARGLILRSAAAASCSSRRAARVGGRDASRARGARHVARAGELQVWNAEEAEMSFLCGSSAVVSFGTTWCGPCAVLAPELATLAAALEDIPSLEDLDIAKVDAEEASSLASQHGIGAYPTTLWMREGREVHRMEGAAPAAALVQLTAMHLLNAEEEEILRALAPEHFVPVPLDPAQAARGSVE